MIIFLFLVQIFCIFVYFLACFEVVWPMLCISMCFIKVGVNHGIFHVYHFWNFLIFKFTWVCSSSSSKNKNIFLNLSISIYLSISKMCSSLFSRGNQACARIANAKRTTHSRDAALSAIYTQATFTSGGPLVAHQWTTGCHILMHREMCPRWSTECAASGGPLDVPHLVDH